ncbi:N-acetyltransferase [Pseudonocardia ailaonensis]|uniref:N-acetyltransferase n=1 Tax=Pseudonocardia ailaonensis TaxID=367279 RepID=A0ABN2MY34_9PSEU
MIVRRERLADHELVDAVQRAAFATGPGEPVEVPLLQALRVGPWFLPQFSLVALGPDGIAGHVIATRGYVGDHPALGVGPLGVAPDQQGTGVGSALMHALLGAAEATGETVVALLGDPTYYSRFGFRAAGHMSPNPEWGPYFQVRLLTVLGSPFRGTFRYAPPFDNL